VQDGLCVVVPRHFDAAKVPAILKRQARWIANALARVQQVRHHLVQQPLPFLPERLELLALGEVWNVHYRESSRARLVLREGARELIFSGKTFPRAAVIAKLKHWLRGRVASGLAPLVFELARQKELTIKKVLPRSQRTRWASCSAKGTLSLNTKLLFLPPGLMRYVLIHELCHTVHMNHSKSFWRLVETHEPHFRLFKRQLREAWKKLPSWLTAP
jgi:predicted metal-dependent hydrolase